MTDPTRWRDTGSDASGFARDLLERDAEMSPPEGAEDAVWAALQDKLSPPDGGDDGAAGGEPAGGGGGGPDTAGASLGAKGLAGAAVVAGVVGAVVLLRPSDEPPSEPEPPPPIPSAITTARAVDPPVPASAFPIEVSDEDATAAPPPKPTATGAPDARAVKAADAAPSALGAEARMLERARRLVNGGKHDLALQQIRIMRRRFPDGALTQERDALEVRALRESGSAGAAKKRTEEFERNHPESPLLERSPKSR